jgi:carotenoid cleavage dioxygenase-like enzyme
MENPRAPLFKTADVGRTEATHAVLVRWTFDLASPSNQVKRRPLDDLAGEFPRFDERYAGLAYRHGWFAAQHTRPGEIRADGLAHWDLTAGKQTRYQFPQGDAPGEPIFVPRSADAAEGDGWLLSVVYRGAEDRSDLTVFEAQDIAAGPIAVASMPRRTPFGFHGNWVSD